ncbi:unnamed protein product, partial [Mesorhabditis spiculigera]
MPVLTRAGRARAAAGHPPTPPPPAPPPPPPPASSSTASSGSSKPAPARSRRHKKEELQLHRRLLRLLPHLRRVPLAAGPKDRIRYPDRRRLILPAPLPTAIATARLRLVAYSSSKEYMDNFSVMLLTTPTCWLVMWSRATIRRRPQMGVNSVLEWRGVNHRCNDEDYHKHNTENLFEALIGRCCECRVRRAVMFGYQPVHQRVQQMFLVWPRRGDSVRTAREID